MTIRRQFEFGDVPSVVFGKELAHVADGVIATGDTDDGEFDVIPPLHSVTITLDVSPTELELAVATSGKSLCPAMMNAIIAAMVVDTTLQHARL